MGVMLEETGGGLSWVRDLGRQVSIGTRVALAGGSALGLLLGVALVLRDGAHLMLGSPVVRVLFVAFLVSGLGVLATIALLPFEVLISRVVSHRRQVATERLRRIYAGLLLAGVVLIHGLLWGFFRVVREPATMRGLLWAGGVAVAAGLTVAAVSFLPLPRRAARERAGALGPLLAFCLGLTLCLGTGWALSQARGPARGPEALSGEARPAEAGGGRAESRFVDVILISIDTLRADHLGCYGYGGGTSPNLDGLAAECALFERAYSQAPWTLPSHASLLTSLYPATCGVELASMFRFAPPRSDVLAPAHSTLAEVLGASGYRTAALVSVLWLGPGFGLDQGFESVELRKGELTTTGLVDAGVEWLEAAGARPSFLFLHLFDVHEYAAPETFRPGRSTADRERLERLTDRAAPNLFDNISEDELRLLREGYDTAVRYVDHEVGRLLAWLKAEDRWESTLIVLLSDHGEEFWEHGGTGHGFTLYEEQLHVPLLVKAPLEAGLGPPGRVADPVGLIDVMPTILDLVGAEVPPHLEGRSLRPLIQGEGLPSRALFAEAAYLFNRRAVIEGDRKYIANRVPPRRPFEPWLLLANLRSIYVSGADELFRLDEDPGETANLLERGPGAAAMHETLVQHLREAGATQQAMIDEETAERLRSLGYVQ